MPTQTRRRALRRRQLVNDENVPEATEVDVAYDPEIVNAQLEDLKESVEARCRQIAEESDRLAAQIRQRFTIELIKLPSHVQSMSVRRFAANFNGDVAAVAKAMADEETKVALAGTSGGAGAGGRAARGAAAATLMAVAATPAPAHRQAGAGAGGPLDPRLPATPSVRAPRYGESIISINGSPLGVAAGTTAPGTLAHAPSSRAGGVAPPSVVKVPLQRASVVEVETTEGNILELANDPEQLQNLPPELKRDALLRLQTLMANVNSMVQHLQDDEEGSKAGSGGGSSNSSSSTSSSSSSSQQSRK